MAAWVDYEFAVYAAHGFLEGGWIAIDNEDFGVQVADGV